MITKHIKLWGAFLAIGLLSSCNNDSSTFRQTEDQTYEEKVMSVEEIEKANPLKFLDATGTYKENFLGDKMKVECTITNSATVATYKDVVVEFTYYSKTKTVLGTYKETVYEFIPPNSSKTVQLKIQNYNNVNSLGWDVVDAVATN